MKAIKTLSLVLLVAGSVNAKQLPENKVPAIQTSVMKLANVFGSFSVHRQHNGAALSWNVVTNNVSTFVIERSYDGQTFDELCECAPTTSRWNRHLDNTVEPGYIYYRIAAYLNDGTVEYSATQMVRIVMH